MPTSKQILTEARSWLGTRFQHQGRVKATAHHRGGCDCLGLIVGVATTLALRAKDGSLLSSHDVLGYGRMPDGGALKQSLEELLLSISITEIKPCDVLLMRFEREPQHVGMVGSLSTLPSGFTNPEDEPKASPLKTGGLLAACL
jgi:cell wall-associated NlpC family hydrolase